MYTEEQVKQMIEKSRETGLTSEFLILTTTPIELPSDEEISKEATGLFGKTTAIYISIIQCKAFKQGAEWMRDKIKGGNK